MADSQRTPDSGGEDEGARGGRDAFTHCLSLLAFVLFGTVLTALLTFGILYLLGVNITMTVTIVIILAYSFVSFELVGPYLIVRQVVKPLEELNEASTRIAGGDFTVQAQYGGNIIEHQRMFENFNLMAKELSSIETLRSDFVSNVSHEFKTPLAAIEGYTALLQSPDLSEEERGECTERIRYNTERLSSLVGNILMINKLENQSIQPELKRFCLDEQIRQILLLQEGAWSKRGIEFELYLEEIMYHGPEQLLYHVWSNLISNAVKYSYENGIIQIYLTRENNVVRFKITDSGIGISQESLEHIFDKFYQADSSRKSQGNGLGLSQVQKILDLTGGKIQVMSEEGKGSTFEVTLSN